MFLRDTETESTLTLYLIHTPRKHIYSPVPVSVLFQFSSRGLYVNGACQVRMQRLIRFSLLLSLVPILVAWLPDALEITVCWASNP